MDENHMFTKLKKSTSNVCMLATVINHYFVPDRDSTYWEGHGQTLESSDQNLAARIPISE